LLSFEQETLSQGGADPEKERSDTNPLQYYTAQAQILKKKKVSGDVFANHSRVRLDNGFFSRRLLEQYEYGGTLFYDGDVLPWSVEVSHREEDETDTRTPRDSEEDNLTFRMRNDRSQGKTTFDYLYQDFKRQDYNVRPYEGIRHSARLNDNSHFRNESLRLGSFAYYNDIESTSIPSTILTMKEILRAEHTENLQTTYEYNYGFRDSGSTENISHYGRASLRHQLYDSLTSTVSVDMRETDSTSLDTTRTGYSINENYNKLIGDFSRINLQATISRHILHSSTTE
jgi:hypothetical protein